MFDLEQVVHLTASPLDADGNPATVTTMTISIRQPDGTSVAGTTQTLIVGEYVCDFTPTQAGRHVVTWTGDGGAGAPFTYTDVFNVAPADPLFVISLADARDSVGDVTEEQLRLYIAAATPVIEDIVGPIVVRSFTETFTGRADSAGRTIITVTRAPVIAVQSITAQQAGMWEPDLSYLNIDSASGVLTLSNWTSFYGAVTVTYTAGRPVVPANILLAVKEQVRFLWQVGQQGNRPGFGDAADDTEWTPSGFAVPRRVSELCAPHRKVSGIA